VIIGLLISVIPLIVAFLSLQRFWKSGLAAGSVKL
jgi:multiple sugar transport system permease protein